MSEPGFNQIFFLILIFNQIDSVVSVGKGVITQHLRGMRFSVSLPLFLIHISNSKLHDYMFKCTLHDSLGRTDPLNSARSVSHDVIFFSNLWVLH